MSTLFVIATPIGNLEDLTLRAARILRDVPVVVAEDTRVTRKILAHVEAKPRVVSFHRRSTDRDIENIVGMLETGDVALVSDAGTPGVNDPGQLIVSAAVERGHEVVPLPGASSIMTALSVSGFYADQFVSYGFLPAGGGKRRRMLGEISTDPKAAVLFETPHRLRDALVDMATAIGGREIVVCRELTKLHEEIWRGCAGDALEHFASPRGEFVIVIAPLERSRSGEGPVASETEILAVAEELSRSYESRRDLANAVAERTGLPRRRVYQLLHGQS